MSDYTRKRFEKDRERKKRKTEKFLGRVVDLTPYERELRKERKWSEEFIKTKDLEKAAEVKRLEEERIKKELTVAQKEYCRTLRNLINFITEEFARIAKEEDRDAMGYRNLADTMKKEGVPTAQKLFLELADDEERHAKRLRAIRDELITELERKLRLYKWSIS